MIRNATMPATVWVAIASNGAGRSWKIAEMAPATAGSPIHPRPRLATVMPSCVAEM